MENSLKNIARAIVAVQQEVKGIEKNLSVGSGNYGYKGVADKDVKRIVGESMAKNGLSLIPISVVPIVNVDTWEEEGMDFKTKNPTIKRKKEVFTQVKTKYLLLHTSGESIEVAGYGQGVDNQDKGAGKATTYAEKYAILYMFLIPTGNIDDADTTHSNEYDNNGNVIKFSKKEIKEKEVAENNEERELVTLTVNDCKSRPELLDVWNINVPLQKEEWFKKVFTIKGKEYPVEAKKK